MLNWRFLDCAFFIAFHTSLKVRNESPSSSPRLNQSNKVRELREKNKNKIKMRRERERQSTINITIRKMLRYIRWNNENKPRSTEETNAFQSSCKKPVIYVSRCLVFQINMFHCRYAATNTTTTTTTTIQSDEINKNIHIMKFMYAVICMKTTQITNFIAMLKKRQY